MDDNSYLVLHDKVSVLKQQLYLFCSQICNLGRAQCGLFISAPLSISCIVLEALIIWSSLTYMSEAWAGKTRTAGLPWHLYFFVVSPAWLLQGSQTSSELAQCSQSTWPKRESQAGTLSFMTHPRKSHSIPTVHSVHWSSYKGWAGSMGREIDSISW